MGVEHGLKSFLDFLVEFGLDGKQVAKLGKGKAAERTEVIHPRDPIGFHEEFFILVSFVLKAFDFDDEVEQVFRSPAIVHQHEIIGQVFTIFGTVAVGDLKA